jgi:hypothetical protein
MVIAHLICPRPAAVVAAPCHLNNIATNIRAHAESLPTVGEICEQLMHVALPMLTTFSALVSMAPPSRACRHLEKDILDGKVTISSHGLNMLRPKILVGEVAAWSSPNPSSELKENAKSAVCTAPLAHQ